MERPDIFLDSICLDCEWEQIPAMVKFYSELLGYRAEPLDEDTMPAVIGPHASISFQPVEGYRPPTWPTETRGQQAHLDLIVKDLFAAAAFARSIGARDAAAQFGHTWQVMLDPAGHPFCLTLNGPLLNHPWKDAEAGV